MFTNIPIQVAALLGITNMYIAARFANYMKGDEIHQPNPLNHVESALIRIVENLSSPEVMTLMEATLIGGTGVIAAEVAFNALVASNDIQNVPFIGDANTSIDVAPAA